MRRVILGVMLVCVANIGTACITPEPLSTNLLPDPIYRLTPPRRDRTVPKHERPRSPARPRPVPHSQATWFPRGRRISRRWTYIVIHHSGTPTGGAREFDRYHRNTKGWDELGYHFVIGNGTDTPDGFVEVGPRWQKQKHGAHCKTPDNYYNEHGIGICLVGDFTRTSPTPRQLASLEQLVRFLCDQCGIPTERVTSHGRITGKTQCPGRHFQLAAFRRALQTPTAATVVP